MNPVRIYFWETGEVYAWHDRCRVAVLRNSERRVVTATSAPTLDKLIAREGALYFFCRWYGKRSVVTPSTQALYQYYTQKTAQLAS